MRKISKLIDYILYIIIIVVLIAAVTSTIWNRPVIFSSVRSNSMYPLFQRSDMLLIKSLSKDDDVKVGDIVLFKVEEGSLSSKGWIVHRIIDGDEISGYITKGDANKYTDQHSGGTGPVQRDWIVSKVLTIGTQPIKIPLIGHLPLLMEKFQTSPYAMPCIAVILAGIVGIMEVTGNKKHKKNKRNGMELQLVYFFGGLTISIIMGATMLATSQRIIVPYEISNNTGVLIGSSVGVVKVGDETTKSLSTINNKSFFPIISTITAKDEQISFSHPLITLKPGDNIETTMTLSPSKIGKFNTTIYIGMFYPFLPRKLIYNLSQVNYWLALSIVSLIPGLPLMLYPIIDGRLRKKTIKEIRRFLRRIKRLIPMFN